jgi:flagellar protein FlaJ
MNGANAYRVFGKNALSYNLQYTLPVALITAIVAIYVLLQGMGLIFSLLFIIIAIVCIAFVAVYPFMNSYVRNNQINNLMPIVITHLSVLSNSPMERSQIIDEIIERKEYGPAVDEFKRVNELTRNLNISFADACRVQAKRTTSQTMADFFDRLANSADAGEQFSTFLNNEQQSAFQTYEIAYAGSINALDLTKEVYISTISAILFMLIMMCVIPFIQAAPITMYATLSVILFLVTLLCLVFGIRLILPADPIWVQNQKKTEVDRKIRLYSAVSVPFCFVVFFIFAYLLPFIPIQIDVAAALTPPIFCGYYARKEQARIKNRDENYPTFIRAVGSTAGVVRKIGDSIERLSTHEFGNLSAMISNLNKRLKARIKATEDPWHTFGRESGSYLIYEFTHMFASSIEAGSDVAKGAMAINNNFLHITGMRKRRFQSAAGYRWVVYGVSVSVGIVFSIAFSVIFMMQNLYGTISTFSTEYLGGMFTATAPLPYIVKPIVSIIIIVAYSIAGAFVIKDSESGRDATMFVDMAGIAWLLAISWVVSDFVMGWATAGI